MKRIHRIGLFLLLGTMGSVVLTVEARTGSRPFAPHLPSVEEWERPPAPSPTIDIESDGEEVLIPELRGIILYPALEDDAVDPQGIPGVVQIFRLPLLESADFRRQAYGYLWQPLTVSQLDELLRDIIRHYRRHHRPVVDVIVPEQDVTDGILTLTVLEGHLGRVRVSGNDWFRNHLFTDRVRLERGAPIDSRLLHEDIELINRNPFRRVDAVYVSGMQPGQTDVVLEVDDRFPLRAYGGFDNTGVSLTGEERFFAGINWGNFLGLDQQFNYQFTTGRYLDHVHAHSASYVAPLPMRHELTLFGSYVESDADLDDTLTLEGESFQAGARYTFFLLGWESPEYGMRFAQELTLGADFKRADNTLEFGEVAVFDVATEIIQGMARYNGKLWDPFGKTAFSGSVYYSPGSFISRRNRDSVFNDARPGAESNYVYGKLGLERSTRLPGAFSLDKSALYQRSNRRLLASEQLGVGGHASVRGYEERAAAGDSGYLLGAELSTPEFSMTRFLRPGRPVRDRWRLLGFVDYGVAEIEDPRPGEPERRYLAGAGPGLRGRVGDYFHLRLDYGFQLRDDEVEDSRDHRIHAAVIFSY